MKLFKSKFTDSFVVRGGEFGISSMNFEQSHTITVSNWIPLFVCGVFVLALLESLFLLFQKFLTKDRNGKSTIAGRNVSSLREFELIDSKRMTNDERFLSGFQRIGGEQIEMTIMRARLDKENQFSEAFKYLCTCRPGNRILARKPINIISNSYMK